MRKGEDETKLAITEATDLRHRQSPWSVSATVSVVHVINADPRLLFYAVGLLIFGFTGIVVVSN